MKKALGITSLRVSSSVGLEFLNDSRKLSGTGIETKLTDFIGDSFFPHHLPRLCILGSPMA